MNFKRRTVLKGLGTALCLPWMESLAADNKAGPPLRTAFIFMPNGVIQEDWKIAVPGKINHLPATLESLDHLKGDITLFSNLCHHKAKANGDGPGDHARNSGTFLTGVQLKKTAGKDIRAGISIDQLIAGRVG